MTVLQILTAFAAILLTACDVVSLATDSVQLGDHSGEFRVDRRPADLYLLIATPRALSKEEVVGVRTIISSTGETREFVPDVSRQFETNWLSYRGWDYSYIIVTSAQLLEEPTLIRSGKTVRAEMKGDPAVLKGATLWVAYVVRGPHSAPPITVLK